MTVSPEVRMAVDIARQFAHLPSAEAAEAIAAHLQRFWTPAMRAALAQTTDELPDSVRIALLLITR